MTAFPYNAVARFDVDSYFTRSPLPYLSLQLFNRPNPHFWRFGGYQKEVRNESEYVKSDEVIKRWDSINGKRAKIITKKWMKEAERIIEPKENDVITVAKLYLLIKDLLKERRADAMTMA